MRYLSIVVCAIALTVFSAVDSYAQRNFAPPPTADSPSGGSGGVSGRGDSVAPTPGQNQQPAPAPARTPALSGLSKLTDESITRIEDRLAARGTPTSNEQLRQIARAVSPATPPAAATPPKKDESKTAALITSLVNELLGPQYTSLVKFILPWVSSQAASQASTDEAAAALETTTEQLEEMEVKSAHAVELAMAIKTAVEEKNKLNKAILARPQAGTAADCKDQDSKTVTPQETEDKLAMALIELKLQTTLVTISQKIQKKLKDKRAARQSPPAPAPAEVAPVPAAVPPAPAAAETEAAPEAP